MFYRGEGGFIFVPKSSPFWSAFFMSNHLSISSLRFEIIVSDIVSNSGINRVRIMKVPYSV